MKIVNNTGIDLKELENKISEFYPYSKKTLGFDRDPNSINLVSDPKNASDILGKTAFYSPGDASITVYTDKRHPKDILRSISHELVHHAQNCRGEFSEIQELEQNYAQTNKKLREMEQEAYLMGNMTFRDWEDGMKKEIDEAYADGPAVDDRRLRYKTAGVKKQRSNSSPSKLSTTAPSKDTKPRKDNKAQNAIRQFGKIMTPEELKFAKKLQDKEDNNNGKLDKNDDQELYFMIVKLLKRQRGLREGEDVKELEEISLQKIKDKFKSATGQLPRAKKALPSPSGHVIWVKSRAEKNRFPWVLAQKKGNMWEMKPNGKNNLPTLESPYVRPEEMDAVEMALEDHGGLHRNVSQASRKKLFQSKMLVPYFKGLKFPNSWINAVVNAKKTKSFLGDGEYKKLGENGYDLSPPSVLDKIERQATADTEKGVARQKQFEKDEEEKQKKLRAREKAEKRRDAMAAAKEREKDQRRRDSSRKFETPYGQFAQGDSFNENKQWMDSKTMNEYNKKKIKEMMNSIITKIKQDLAEAEKPDFLDVDKDGDKKEPMSKAADEKKDDGEEKSDKDLSKVPPQLRKHVAKKMDESETVEESSCDGGHKREDDEVDEGSCGNHKREEDELDEGCCGKCGQSDSSCGCGGRMYEEDEGMEGFLSERRNNLFGKLVNEWFSAEKK